MTKEELIKLKEDIFALTEEETKERNNYLRGLAIGDIQGPSVGYPSIDKPWLKYYSDETKKKTIPEMTVYDYLYMKNIDNMDSVALNYLGVNIKYKTLFKKIDEITKSLIAMGVKKGDVITSCLVNMPESVYLIYAANKIGAVVDLIDPFVTHDLMETYCKKTNSKGIGGD